MGATKFPILDEAFLPKMIAECQDDKERGLIYILYITGMHGFCLRQISGDSLIREGEKTYIQWKRPKTHKTMRCLLPKDKLPQIKAFLDSRKYSIRHYNNIILKIALKAGFEGVSTMTFRHTRCLRAMRDEGFSPFEVPYVMGATMGVIGRNYAKIREDQLERRD